MGGKLEDFIQDRLDGTIDYIADEIYPELHSKSERHLATAHLMYMAWVTTLLSIPYYLTSSAWLLLIPALSYIQVPIAEWSGGRGIDWASRSLGFLLGASPALLLSIFS